MDKKGSLESNPSSSTGGFLRSFELVIEFLKAILWPLLILFIFISLQRPLFDLVETLPFLINKSSEISVAGVSLKVNQKLQKEGSPKLRTAASHISKDALLYLINLGKYQPGGSVYSKSEYFTEEESKSINELKKRGLVGRFYQLLEG